MDVRPFSGMSRAGRHLAVSALLVVALLRLDVRRGALATVEPVRGCAPAVATALSCPSDLPKDGTKIVEACLDWPRHAEGAHSGPVVRGGVTSAECRRRVPPYSPAPEELLSTPEPDWLDDLAKPSSLPYRRPDRIHTFFTKFVHTRQGRSLVEEWLARSARFNEVALGALRSHKLPPKLLALVFIESGFVPTAVSKAGAVGLWQFMPATGKQMGLRIDDEVDERRDPLRSSDAAAKHLSDLHAQFGSWELALAAYDLGARRLTARMESTGLMDFWQLADSGVLPAETVDYVPKILAFSLVLSNLELLGFRELRSDASLGISRLTVPAGISLALVARAAGTSVALLREINPQFLGSNVPSAKGPFGLTPVNVPNDGLVRAHAMLPLLVAGLGMGLEARVPETFDWSHDELPEDLQRPGKSGATRKNLADRRRPGTGRIAAWPRVASSLLSRCPI